MRRLLSLLARLPLVLIVLAVAVVGIFRLTAVLRETHDPRVAVGETARFVEVSGLAIHYRQWGPQDGEPLVLVPGTLAWSETWRDIARPLGEADYRVIALDLPPFGYSQRLPGRVYSRQALAAVIGGFADALGLDRFALAGHSFGGGATVEAAMLMPERISRLVLLDVALGLDAPSPGGILPAILSIPALRTTIASATFANPSFTGMGLRSFISDDALATRERVALYQSPLAVRGTSSAIGDWLATALFAGASGSLSASPASYEALNVPTLVVWGRDDTVTPLAQGERIADLLPDARLVVLDGVNHIPHLEDPAATAAAMEDFLSSSR